MYIQALFFYSAPVSISCQFHVVAAGSEIEQDWYLLHCLSSYSPSVAVNRTSTYLCPEISLTMLSGPMVFGNNNNCYLV